jgi:hypothetical protein
MAEAVSRQRWAHTSAVMCVIANCHRDPKKTRPFTPADFDPHRQRKDAPQVKVGIGVLKQVFVNRPQGD